MKNYYISGTYYCGDDFEEDFEKIVQAKSKQEAKRKLADIFEFDALKIEQCYETSFDALV
jgi:hypothetical protein